MCSRGSAAVSILSPAANLSACSPPGAPRARRFFPAPAKNAREIGQALDAGIRCFNVESEAELERINDIAGNKGRVAPVSLRINPDVDAGTHPYIATGLKESKFGIPAERAFTLYRRAERLPAIDPVGIDCHIGSQLTGVEPFLDAIDRLTPIVEELAGEGIRLRHFDMGGGLGVRYGDETPPRPDELMRAVADRFRGRELELVIEPGRSIAANAGIFVTAIEYLKSNSARNFAIVDGAMNDLLRPALYGAWQEIIPVKRASGDATRCDVVGPVCESGRFSRQRPRTPRAARRSARGARRRRLCVCHEQQLQFPAARGGSHGRRRRFPYRAAARGTRRATRA